MRSICNAARQVVTLVTELARQSLHGVCCAADCTTSCVANREAIYAAGCTVIGTFKIYNCLKISERRVWRNL